MEGLVHAWPGVKIMTERDAVTTTLCRHGRKLDVRFDTKNQVASFHPYEVSAELDVLLCNPVPMSRVCGIVSAFFRRAEALAMRKAFFTEAVREFGAIAAPAVTDSTCVVVLSTPLPALRLIVTWTVAVTAAGDVQSQADLFPALSDLKAGADFVSALSSLSALFNVAALRIGCMPALRAIMTRLTPKKP